jgi:hypothetical protein
MSRRSFACLLPLLALAACAPDGAGAPAAPPEPARPAIIAPEPPATWSEADSQVEVSLHIDTAVEAHPRLYARLRDEGRARLETFARESREFRGDDPVASEAAPYAMEIGYAEPVETSRIFSLQGSAWFYSGGAHGNPSVSAVLWDKVGERMLEPAVLFRPGADLTVLDRALCAAIRAAKAARTAEGGYELDPVSPCEKSVEEAIALAPGTIPGKAGGLIFLFAPYELGSYAEGGYSIVVPLDAFAALLSPDWADQFAGAPTAETLSRYHAG